MCSCFSDKCRAGLCLPSLFFFPLCLWLSRTQTESQMHSCEEEKKNLSSLHFFFFFCLFLREVERLCFLDCSALAAVCSFSSEAHLVGYYVKEMESIVEQWVTLFTGKSEDQRQGITHPPDLTFPGNSRCFIWEEGKVQRTLEMVGMTTGTLVQKGGEVTKNIWAKFISRSLQR